MLHNFFKLAFRNLLKKKIFSFINLIGLVLGVSAFLIILHYVAFELSFEDFHADKENIYHLSVEKSTETGQNIQSVLPNGLQSALLDNTDVEAVSRFYNISYQNNSVIYKNETERKSFEVSDIFFAEASFHKVLNLPLQIGSFEKLDQTWKVVLGHELSNKLFGDSDPIGKSISVSNNIGSKEYEVVGVLAPFPQNTHFQFDALLSFPTLNQIEGKNTTNSWEYVQSSFFIKAKKHADVQNIDLQTSQALETQKFFAKLDGNWDLNLTNIQDLHFSNIESAMIQNKGNKNIVLVLSIMGLFILMIAWVNYINLSTIRAMERAKEVGVRKVLGANQSQLRIQFLAESFMMNLVASIIAYALVQNAIPALQEYTNPMLVSDSQQITFWVILASIIVVGSLFSGLYPAFVLSNYKPTEIVGGKIKVKSHGELLRKSLVIFQYAASIILIGGSIAIQKQINFMLNYDLGIDLEQMLVLQSPPSSVNGDSKSFYESVNSFREGIKKFPEVASVSSSSAIPGEDIGWGSNSIGLLNGDSKENLQFSLIAMDQSFFDTYDLELVAGRYYNSTDDPWRTGEIIINEKAAQTLGFQNPEDAIDIKLKGGNMFPTLTVKGVIKNHNHVSLKEEFSPILYVKSSWSNFYSIELAINEKLSANEKAEVLTNTLAKIEGQWKRFFPETAFDFTFADDTFNAQYQNDKNFQFIVGLFSVLAIIIATLGLLGLSSYNLVQRSKEMSIRKVLGASSPQLLTLLSKDYFILLVIAGMVATPITWYLVHQWLENYAFQIDLGITVFIIPLFIIFGVSALTIGVQILKSTRLNPIQALRNN